MDQFLGLFSLKLELIYWKRCSLSKTSNLTPLAIYGGGVLPAIMLVSIFFIRNLCNCRCQKHWFWLIIKSLSSIPILKAQHFLYNLRTRKSLNNFFVLLMKFVNFRFSWIFEFEYFFVSLIDFVNFRFSWSWRSFLKRNAKSECLGQQSNIQQNKNTWQIKIKKFFLVSK